MATRRLNRLTVELLASLEPPPLTAKGRANTYDVPDAGRGAVAGLRLRVTSGGAKTWVLLARYPGGKRNGKCNPTRRAIGPWPAVKLPEAREIASGWNTLIRKGVDPQELAAAEQAAREEKAREQARLRANTFANVAEDFIERHAKKKRTGSEIARLIRRELIKRWGDTPVSAINKGHVIKMVEEIADRSGTSAHQAFVYSRRIFNWALRREDPQHPLLGITSNPCAFVDVNDLAGKRKPRQRVLNDHEIRLIWRATEGTPLQTYPFKVFVRLLLILGCRRGELAAATRDEIDLSKGTWALAGSRTKVDEPRIIPLPKMAIEILASLPVFTGPFVFTTTHGQLPISGFSYVKDALDRKITELNGGMQIAPWTLHDLRRSMRTGLSALPILPLVAELMIGHRQRGIAPVYDVYSYLPEQRAGFEAWCARLLSIVEPRPDNVVALRT